QKIGAAFDEGFGLLMVIVAELREGGGAGGVDVFGSWSDGAGDEAGMRGSGTGVGGFARDAGGGEVELVGAVFEVVVGEGHARAAAGVGLDDVGAGFEVGAMDAGDDVGAGGVEDFGAILAPEVVGLDGQRNLVNHGSHGPIENEDTLLQDVGERLPTL